MTQLKIYMSDIIGTSAEDTLAILLIPPMITRASNVEIMEERNQG